MIKLMWKNKWIDFESLEWSGTDTQCSRQVAFTVASNPYDKDFTNLSIGLGDLVYLYSDNKQLFVGTVTNREKSAEIGTASYTAMDFMHHLLRSNATYKFTNTTPEKVVQKVCKDLSIQTGTLAPTKTNISKAIYSDQSVYDIVVGIYKKAIATTGKKYMPVMSGNKVCIIEKGSSSGVKLTQGVNITAADYSDTTSNMVDVVNIYDDKYKKLGQVQNKKHVEKYGVYQQSYTKESGVNAKSQAQSMLVGITRTASIEAVGDIRAVSGKSIVISDKATGLSGTFFITSDSHTFQNGVHTMSLGITWNNTMEDGAETESDSDSEKSSKPSVANSATCYYLSGSSVYHSSTSCTACKGKSTTKTTVAQIKTIKIKSGKNKGKRKYKACSKCWNT